MNKLKHYSTLIPRGHDLLEYKRFMRVHFVILPSSKISAMAAGMAKRYAAKFPHWFVVDNIKFYPHITLFLLSVSGTKFKELQAATAKMLSRKKSLVLDISRHSYYQTNGGGWVGLKIKDSKALTILRKNLLRELKPFNPAGKKLENFSPHITLTKFKKRQFAKIATQGSQIPIREFIANRLAICLSDDKYWQVYKIIKEFKLN